MLNINDLARITFERVRSDSAHKLRPTVIECPSIGVLQRIFEVLFFASLKTDEGRPIQVRIYYINSENPDPNPPPMIRADRWKTTRLGKRIPFTTPNLVKFAKAADAWVTGIAIFHDESAGIYIWGLVDQILHLSTTLVREIEGTYVQPGAFHAVINGPADITVLRETTFVARLAQDLLITDQNDCFFEGPISEMIDHWVEPLTVDAFRLLRRSTGRRMKRTAAWKERAKYDWVRTISRLLIHIQGNYILDAHADPGG